MLNTIMRTFAVVIGISSYESEKLSDLPAAPLDALRFGRALVHYGIPCSQCFFLFEAVTLKQQVEHIVAQLAMESEPFDLIFYFCGHGYRSDVPTPRSYLLFSNSIDHPSGFQNAMNIEDLLLRLCQTKAKDVYLFIDACAIRINSIINPSLQEEMQGNPAVKKGLFCLSSSGIFPSYESARNQAGFFTTNLLKGFSYIRKTGASITTLIHFIRDQLEQLNLPMPEMYNIETSTLSFLKPLPSSIFNGIIFRRELIAAFQDLLIENPGRKIVIVGDTGSGKTTFAKQLLSKQLRIISYDSNENKNFLPGTILIFDEIHSNALEADLHVFFHSEDSKLVDCPSLRIPPFTIEEVNLLTPEHPEFFMLATSGNPRKIHHLLRQFDRSNDNYDERQNFQDVLSALYSTGGFIDRNLFLNTFEIEEESLSAIERLGILNQTENGICCHESIVELAEKENLTCQPVVSMQYWAKQCIEIPRDFTSSSHLVKAAIRFGYSPSHDSDLEMAFRTLYSHGEKGQELLGNAAKIYFDQKTVTSSMLFLIEVLLTLGKTTLAQRLLSEKHCDPSHDLQAKITYHHTLWRLGFFRECIDSISRTITSLSPTKSPFAIYLHRAACHFFLGNWDEAKRDFSFILKKSKNPYFIGRAKILLGTIDGLRGHHIAKNQELILQGVRNLLRENDTMGAWIGWNNLGEILCKAGQATTSKYYLEKALDIALECQHKTLVVETLRNLLSWQLHSADANKAEMFRLLTDIENLIQVDCEIIELLQVYNTLSTCELYLGNEERSKLYLRKSLSKTKISKEYHIYSLANLSHLLRSKGLEAKADHFFQKALKLAKNGNNLFAIRQIEREQSKISERGKHPV